MAELTEREGKEGGSRASLEHPLRKFKIWAQCGSALVLVAVPTFFPEEVVSDTALLVVIAIVLLCLVVFSFVEARWTLQAPV